MKIGIDANWAIYEKAGIGKYSYNLIKALLEEDRRNSYILFFNFFKAPRQRFREIKEMFGGSRADVEFQVSVLPAKIKEWLTQRDYPLQRILKKEVDVYYSPFFSGIAKNGFKNTVVTVHDLSFVRFPEHRGEKISNYYLQRTKQAIKASKKVIAVSQATKSDLVKFLKVSPKKIEVIYEGVSREFSSKKNKRKQKLPKNYILSVCTLEPRKNLARVISAYSLLKPELQQKYKLVLAGGKGWGESGIYDAITKHGLKNKVILPGYVDQKELVSLYQNADVFVYPSLYEGFGLPPLEAMACGTPVVTSNVSSLPEVVGKAGVLIDPYKESKIALGLEKILLDKKRRTNLSKKGILQAKKFSWNKAAKQAIKLFESIN